MATRPENRLLSLMKVPALSRRKAPAYLEGLEICRLEPAGPKRFLAKRKFTRKLPNLTALRSSSLQAKSSGSPFNTSGPVQTYRDDRNSGPLVRYDLRPWSRGSHNSFDGIAEQTTSPQDCLVRYSSPSAALPSLQRAPNVIKPKCHRKHLSVI
jgi:hypothetical protein